MQRFFLANNVDCAPGLADDELEKYQTDVGLWYIQALLARSKEEEDPPIPDKIPNLVTNPLSPLRPLHSMYNNFSTADNPKSTLPTPARNEHIDLIDGMTGPPPKLDLLKISSEEKDISSTVDDLLKGITPGEVIEVQPEKDTNEQAEEALRSLLQPNPSPPKPPNMVSAVNNEIQEGDKVIEHEGLAIV